MSPLSRPGPFLLTVGLAGTLALSGCGEGTTGTANPSEPSATSSAAATSGAVPTTPVDDADVTATAPFPADTRPDLEDASPDSRVTVSDVRVGRHDGFDRVVFEVGGTGTPGWDVRYVDQASSQGSGEAVPVAGAAILQVTLTGVGYPFDTGVDEYPRGTVDGGAGDVVQEVFFDATFEGTSVAFVGTTATNPFRVYALEGPARVVLEVAHGTS